MIHRPTTPRKFCRPIRNGRDSPHAQNIVAKPLSCVYCSAEFRSMGWTYAMIAPIFSETYFALTALSSVHEQAKSLNHRWSSNLRLELPFLSGIAAAALSYCRPPTQMLEHALPRPSSNHHFILHLHTLHCQSLPLPT